MRDNRLEPSLTCSRTPRTLLDAPLHGSPQDATIAYEPITSRCNSIPSLTTNTTIVMRRTQYITHTHPTHLGGGIPHTQLSRKIRNKTNTPTTHLTAYTLTNLLDTSTDIEFEDTISQLLDTWHCKTKHGTTLTEKILERCALRSYKDDQSISQF